MVRKLLLFPLLLLMASPALPGAANGPRIPPVAKNADGFVPRGWYLLNKASGDLNRDGAPDLALVIASEQEQREDDPQVAAEDRHLPARRLIIAFAKADGYHRVVVDDAAIMDLYIWKGEPLQRLSIQRGVLIIKHAYTTNSIWEERETDRFQWRNGGFEEIGKTQENEWTTPESRSIDANLITGRVVESYDGPERLNDEETPFQGSREFRVLRVGRLASLPANASAPLTPDPMPLRVREDVVRGRAAWHGADDFSATVSAAMVGKGAQTRLYVRAVVTDRNAAAADTVRLANDRGAVLRPEATARHPLATGFVWEGSYLPSALGLRYESRQGDWVRAKHAPNEPGEPYLRASVEVERAGSGRETLLSSSGGGRRWPGLLWLGRRNGLPRLGDPHGDSFSYFPMAH